MTVKTFKHLISDNFGPSGSMNTDKMAMAFLIYRHTPDLDTHRLPLQVLFAGQLWDTVLCDPHHLLLRQLWMLTREVRKAVLAKRHEVLEAQLEEYTRALKVWWRWVTTLTTVKLMFIQRRKHKVMYIMK